VEKALATALTARFPADTGTAADFAAWNKAYIAAMARVYEQFGERLDVAVVFADAMMAIAPWQLWDLQTGAPREDSQTLRVKAVLDAVLAAPGGMAHPGALHKYIHLMELSPTPEAALRATDALRTLVPDAGHLRHMPGHIDLLIGDYRRVLAGATDAMAADDKYLAHHARDFYQFYTQHNASFTVYAAMLAGRLTPALEACDRMERWLPDDFIRTPNPPIADWMEGFLTYRVHVLVRFGRWADLLALPFPADRAFYSVTTATLHYGRALALALTDRLPEAEAEQADFRASRARIQPTRQAFPNQWKDIFDIAEAMLAGEIAYRAGRVEEGFGHLRKSIALSDNLIYAEPWGWMQPPRHAYGALQLEQGNVEEAARAYAEDLGFATTLPRALRHPNNVWALHGYHECLVKLGRTDEASMVKRDLDIALGGAEVPIESSCLCRRVAKQCC
jgi:tetratricopeptide (TPR) repeat protein